MDNLITRTGKKINPFLKTNNDTGFGNNPNSYGGRFINKDGTFNLRREGVSLLSRLSLYQRMLMLPTWRFISLVIVFYFTINVLFTLTYYFIGANDFQGLMSVTPWARFKELFFFSTQTFTTVGYGRVNPSGDLVNLIASIEALTGFLSFAIATGLIYGRFAKPKSYLVFSENALIAPYKDRTAFMFRFATFKDNHILTNVEIKVNIGLKVEENGLPVYKYYDLNLERSKVDSLSMNWTVVHPIDENSPFMGYTKEDIIAGDVEAYILVTGFDDVFSSHVLQRTSYTYNEIVFDAKFMPMYRESEDGQTTILEMQKLNEIKSIHESR